MTTREDRAFAAAWKIVSAWDGKITKPVLRKAIDAAIAEVRSEESSLRDRCLELEKALEPFADEAMAYDPPERDDGDIAWASDFQIGALRRARSLIQKQKEGK